MPSKEFLRDAHLAFLEAWEIKEELVKDGMDETQAGESAGDYFLAVYPNVPEHQAKA